MKAFLKRLPKRVIAVATGVAVVAALSAPALAAFGPDRPTKAWSPDTDAFNHVTFNSFTGVGNGIGDERDFMRGVQVGRDSVWSDPVKDVAADAEIEAKIYIHNGADPAMNDAEGNPGVAKNVSVRVALPTDSKATQQTTAYIAADNAQPKEVFDTLDITGANSEAFALEYVPGSAKLFKGGVDTPLADTLVTTGVNLGDQKGCFEFVQEVKFRMKVKKPRYTVSKQVRLSGQTAKDWTESVATKAGDKVEWSIAFKNTGGTQLKDVAIVDEVPAGLKVVPGSVVVYDANNTAGYKVPDTAIQANGRQLNIGLGNHNPLPKADVDAGKVSAQIIFATTVETGADKCDKTTLVNKAFVTPKDQGSIADTAEVVVAAGKESCAAVQSAATLPSTGPGEVMAIVAATTVAGAVAHRVYMTRRFAR